MRESLHIDKGASDAEGDLRERVIEAVEAGASRREAAERFEVSVASAVKWLQRWRQTRSAHRNRVAVHFGAGRVRGRDFGSDCGATRVTG
jgi:hypothetical protein